jgi:hypothetical protein
MNRVNEDVCIQFHKLIDSNDEKGAIELLETSSLLDVMYEHNKRLPIFSAISNKMTDLAVKIVNHPTFDALIEDGFGESLLECLIYMYTTEETYYDDLSSMKEECAKLIKSIIEQGNADVLNHKDLDDDTAINIACGYPKMLWIVEALASKKLVDVNIINVFECSALTSAIINQNTEAIKILAKRKDLEVTTSDLELADKNGIDLAKFGIEAAIKLQKAHEYAVATK